MYLRPFKVVESYKNVLKTKNCLLFNIFTYQESLTYFGPNSLFVD